MLMPTASREPASPAGFTDLEGWIPPHRDHPQTGLVGLDKILIPDYFGQMLATR